MLCVRKKLPPLPSLISNSYHMEIHHVIAIRYLSPKTRLTDFVLTVSTMIVQSLCNVMFTGLRDCYHKVVTNMGQYVDLMRRGGDGGFSN